MRIDPEKVAALIAEIAQSQMLSRYKRLAADAVRAKEGPNDLVTIVDEAVERELKRALLEETPGAAFVGEESAAADPSIADAVARADQCWIVDPLDGTRNFVNHVDEFGTIVAYVERGETLAGWIYAAPLGEIAICVRGEGVSYAGATIAPAPQKKSTPDGLRSTGWLTAEWKPQLTEALKARVTSRPGHCSAYAYLKLIRGEVDFKLSSRIHAWDHAAGALMLAELGGEARWLDTGDRYRPSPSADRPFLATAPGRDWRDIADRLVN